MSKILVTGCNGQLGSEFKKIQHRYSKFTFFFKDLSLDITDKSKLEKFIMENEVNIILNTAAYTDVRKSEKEKYEADRINNYGVKNIVEICEKFKLKLIHFSTDYVYSANTNSPIDESKITNPVNYYGISKRNGEIYIENSNSESIVIRTSWLYSSHGKNFVNTIIEKAKKEKKINVICDQFGCPTYAKDLALDTMNIISSNIKLDFDGKIYNYSNLGFTSWSEFAKQIIKYSGLKCMVNEVSSNFFQESIKRPKYSVTSKNKIINNFNLDIPDWKKSLKNCIIK